MLTRLGRRGDRSYRLRGLVPARYSRVTAAVFWGCFVGAAVGFTGVDPLVATGGLRQRLCIVVGLGWLVAVALWLSRHGSDREWHP